MYEDIHGVPEIMPNVFYRKFSGAQKFSESP